MDRSVSPVVVIGAGPVGLAAAAHLLERGLEPLVLEGGIAVGRSVREWGHVRLFTPWRYVVDRAAVDLLRNHGWDFPDPDTYPTGDDLVSRYLEPLSGLPVIRSRIRLNAQAVSVTRDGLDKMTSPAREDAPFLVTTRSVDGREEGILASAVIDASGTWTQPNPLGASGRPAIGESAVVDHIAYGIPDVLTTGRTRYAGKRVLVVGSGHSAFNVLLDLIDLADDVPGTEITWAIRKPADRLQHLFGGGISDALPARGELGARVRLLVEHGRLRLETGLRITRLEDTASGIIVSGPDRALSPVDEMIAATGFRPDVGLLWELRMALDPVIECPVALTPLIDPNLHSCGTVPPHGAMELRHPEANIYIVGMKSYGRAPTFLMLTGYEQVRSVAAALAGDWDAARDVQLVLPETGVCSTSVLSGRGVACCGSDTSPDRDQASGCCGGPENTVPVTTAGCCESVAPQLVQLTAARQGACC